MKTKIVFIVITILFIFPLYLSIQSLSEKVIGEKEYTPDGQFYIETTSMWNYRYFIPTSPGDGSFNNMGNIKLYDKNHNLIFKKFSTVGFFRPKIYIDNDSITLVGENGWSWDLEKFRWNY